MRSVILLIVVLLVAPVATGLTPTYTDTHDDPVPPKGGPSDDLVAVDRDDASARVTVRELPRATSVNDRDANKLFDDLERRYLSQGPDTRLPVIITGIDTADAHGLVQEAEAALDRALDARVFEFLPAFFASLSLEESLRLATLDEVRQLEYNTRGTPELETATVFSGARAVQQQLGITGDADGDPDNFTHDDVNIAVLDTGIHGGHADFQDGKIVVSYDAGAQKEVDPVDSGSHGTHVASIAAGLGRGDPRYTGVAPGAGLVNIQISGSEGSTTDNVLHALEWAIEHKDAYYIRVLTMSFGFGPATDGTSAMELAFDKAWDAGIVTFKSAGNSGPERTTVTVPGAARGIIAVGAMLDPGGIQAGTPAGAPEFPEEITQVQNQGGFVLAGFSSRGPTTDGRVKPDIAAPGWSITAADANTDDGYTTLSGTSMAAPFAAGTAALVLSANPGLSPDEVRAVLRGSSEDWGPEGADVDFGWGRVDSLSATVWSLSIDGTEIGEVEPPTIPRHEARFGRADETGIVTQEIELNATGALGLTFISEQRALGLQVLSGNDVILESATSSLAVSRQIQRGMLEAPAGTYTVVLIMAPGSAYSLDIAHSEHERAPLVGFDPEAYGQHLPDPPLEQAPTPGPGPLFLIALSLLIVPWLRSRRRRP